MALPGVSVLVRDGGLGIVPPGTGQQFAKIGPAPVGVVNSVLSVTDNTSLQKVCGNGGPLVEAAALALDGGVTYGATFTSAATVLIPGVSFTTLAFGAGTAIAGDTTTISTAGTVTQISGAGTLAITHSSSCPADAYTVVLTVTGGGVLGAGFFTYSLDGGATVSQPFLIPASGSFVITDGNDANKAGSCSTGLLLTFAAGTYVVGTTYSFATPTAAYTTTDLTNAFNGLTADTRFTSGVGLHVVGPASTVANAATLLASLDTLMGTAAGSFKFDGAMIEVPSDTDANTLSA